MPTPGERRALLFIASVAALGVAVRGWREFRQPYPAALAGNHTALARQIEAVDSAIAVTSSKRKARAPRAVTPPQPPDPALRPAKGRARRPPVGDTQRVDPRQAYWDRAARIDSMQLAEPKKTNPARYPRSSVFGLRSPESGPRSRSASPPVDLDLAGYEEVALVPLIGPALSRRIVNDRIENGPFGSLAELERVRGITPAFARRLAPFVTFSRVPRLDSAGERRPRSKSERRPGGESRP